MPKYKQTKIINFCCDEKQNWEFLDLLAIPSITGNVSVHKQNSFGDNSCTIAVNKNRLMSKGISTDDQTIRDITRLDQVKGSALALRQLTHLSPSLRSHSFRSNFAMDKGSNIFFERFHSFLATFPIIACLSLVAPYSDPLQYRLNQIGQKCCNG